MSVEPRRRLVIVRHATAEPQSPSDVDRALTPTGRSEAARAGAWLGEQGVVPDVALVSTAARTRETWAQLCDAAGWQVDPSLEGALYSSGPENALDLVRVVPDSAVTVLLLGHNPTVTDLVHLLDDGAGDPAVAVAMAQGFPPATLAVLELHGPWAELTPAGAEVVAFRPGRD